MNVPFTIKTQLIGDFNLENILAAIETCRVLGITDDIIERAIRSFKAPIGRQEEVVTDSNMPTVMVDFAHTANSFENILPEVRKRTTGRLIHIFGAAGERDHGKRPEMGKVASFYDDIIILTSEDPRSESVDEINLEIASGVNEKFVNVEMDQDPSEKSLYFINDRAKAIQFALSIAKKGDTIIATGKGHEKTMNYGDGEKKWSDQEAIKQIVSKKI
jgi:UDP-N-acetylmuramoyl-L-alanyl-D-glutamate--2,6-diaminopimelate ligase